MGSLNCGLGSEGSHFEHRAKMLCHLSFRSAGKRGYSGFALADAGL